MRPPKQATGTSRWPSDLVLLLLLCFELAAALQTGA
jgi:hypothetical protein